MEIGNHTHRHLDLSMLGMPEQLSEIESAEDALIEHGLGASSLCYPYGRFNSATRDACTQAGVKAGFALGRRPAHIGDNLLFLPRIVVGFSDRLPKLLEKIHFRPKLPTFRKAAPLRFLTSTICRGNATCEEEQVKRTLMKLAQQESKLFRWL